MLKQSWSTEKTIFLCAAISFCVFSYLLYDDSILRKKNSDHNLVAIGKVQESVDDVRLKNANNFLWAQTRSKERVHRGDSVFTGPNATATIVLDDGSTLDVRPNSLIVLNFEDNQMKLDLKFGQLIGQLSETTTLRVENKGEMMEIAGRGSKLEVGKSRTGEARVKVISGEASVMGQKLSANQALDIDTAGKTEPVVVTTISLREPADQSKLYVSEGNAVNFSWDITGKAQSYEIEISPTSDFSKQVYRRKTNDQQWSLSQFPAHGSYFWRVKAYSKAGLEVGISTPFSVGFLRMNAPEVISPQHLSKFNFERDEHQELKRIPEIDVEWQDSEEYAEEAPDYVLQLAQDEKFTQLVSEEKISNTTWKTPILNPGNYYFRVQARVESRPPSAWSKTLSFSIDYPLANKKPQPPRLAENTILHELPSEKPLRIEWDNVQFAKEYTVEVSKSENFGKLVQNHKVSTSRWDWADPKLGSYHFRVRAQNQDGELSPYSSPGRISIRPKIPELTPIAPIQARGQERTPPPQAVELKWSEVPAAEQYVLEVAKDPEFKTKQTKITRSPASTLTLPTTGKYYWRVQPQTRANKALTSFSPKSEIDYTYTMPPAAPQVGKGPAKLTYFMQVAAPPYIFLEWKKQQEVSSYQIEISQNPDFSNPVIAETIATNRYLIQKHIPEGNYYWRVRSLRIDLESDWGPSREFTLMSSN